MRGLIGISSYDRAAPSLAEQESVARDDFTDIVEPGIGEPLCRCREPWGGRSERDVHVPIYVPFGSIRYARFGSIGLNVAVQALLVGRATPAWSAVILLTVGTFGPMGDALVAALVCATGSAGAGAGRAHAAVSVLPDALGAKTVLSGCWLVTCRS